MLASPDHIRRILCVAALSPALSDAGSVLKGAGRGQPVKLFGFNALPILTHPFTGPGSRDKPAMEPESVIFTARKDSTLHLLNSQRDSKHSVQLQVQGAPTGGVRTVHNWVFEITMHVALTQRNLLLKHPIDREPKLDTTTAVATFPNRTPVTVQTGFILDPASPVRFLIHPCFLFSAGICGRAKLHIPRTDPDAVASIIEKLIQTETDKFGDGTSTFLIGQHRRDVLTWRGFLGAWRGFVYTMVVLYHRLGKLALLRALGDPPGLLVVRSEKVGRWDQQIVVVNAVLWNWGKEVRDWLERLNKLHERVEGDVGEVDWDAISRASAGRSYEERKILDGLWES